MYIKKEYCPGLHMFIYTYKSKEAAEKITQMYKFSKAEYNEISNTWKVKIW